MARYARLKEVKQFLTGKVRFAEAGDQDPNKLTTDLFNTLVSQAETQLEIDLMHRYDAPLRGNGGTFEELPEQTKIVLRTCAEIISAIRILETDFGRGTAVNGDKYTEKLQKRYETVVGQLVEYKKETYSTWLRPPLAGLILSYQNKGDSGFRGRAHHHTSVSHESADYATKQINSPEENFFNGHLDRLVHGDTGND